MAKITLKVVVIGNSNVGKSAIIRRFAEDKYIDQNSPTVGADFKMKRFSTGEITANISLWDTAGQERFRCLIPAYYRRAQGVMFVYDITNRQSFNELNDWLMEVNRYATEKHIKMLIANKNDFIEQVVTREEGMAFARQHNMLFMETSAKTGACVTAAFQELIETILQDPSFTFIKNENLKVVDRSSPFPSCKMC